MTTEQFPLLDDDRTEKWIDGGAVTADTVTGSSVSAKSPPCFEIE